MSSRFRTFLLQKVCTHMDDKDVSKLKYIQDLPMSSLNPQDVLWELEKQGKFSSSNIIPLATMMDSINRKDLAHVVKQLKQSMKSYNCKQLNGSEFLMGHVVAAIQAIQQVVQLLLDQLEALRESISGNSDYSIVSKFISKAVDVVEQNLGPEISQASRSLPQSKEDSPHSEMEDNSEIQGFPSNEIQSRPLPPTPYETPQPPIEEENQSSPGEVYDTEEIIYEKLPVPLDQSRVSSGDEGPAQPTAEPCSVKDETRQEEIIQTDIDHSARKQPKAKPPPPPVPPKPQKQSPRQSQDECDTYVQLRKVKQSECEHSTANSLECRKKEDSAMSSLIEPDQYSLQSMATANNQKSSYTACTPDPDWSDSETLTV